MSLWHPDRETDKTWRRYYEHRRQEIIWGIIKISFWLGLALLTWCH